MYLQHFGLTKNPFLLNAGALYYSRSHSAAMAHLLHGVRHGNGISLLVGSPGTGKTALLHSLVDFLSRTDVATGLVLFPMVRSAGEILQQVLSGFHAEDKQRSTPPRPGYLTPCRKWCRIWRGKESGRW